MGIRGGSWSVFLFGGGVVFLKAFRTAEACVRVTFFKSVKSNQKRPSLTAAGPATRE